MSEEVTREYSNGEVTVVWKQQKCIHSAECINHLGKVFNPRNRPWVDMDKGTSEEIMHAVDHCPSAALSYYKKEE